MTLSLAFLCSKPKSCSCEACGCYPPKAEIYCWRDGNLNNCGSRQFLTTSHVSLIRTCYSIDSVCGRLILVHSLSLTTPKYSSDISAQFSQANIKLEVRNRCRRVRSNAITSLRSYHGRQRPGSTHMGLSDDGASW